MKTVFSFVLFSVLILGKPVFSKEPVAQVKPVGKAQISDPDSSAPLVIASDSGPKIRFQIGADAFGGMSGLDFVGGVNATFLYPIMDLLWLGIRPSLHYAMAVDSPYDTVWMHADLVANVNVIKDPVRLYGIAAGGYSFAADGDLYDKLAHGYSVMGGVGVAWQPDDSNVGLFCELGFRYGSATAEISKLLLDESGKPVFDTESFSYSTETYDRAFELSTIFVNLGLTVSP